MDSLGLEKGSADSQAEEYCVISQPNSESVTTDKMMSFGQFGSDCERKTTNSVSEKKVKTDFSYPFSLFSKYFRENGSLKTVVGVEEKLNPGNCDTIEDVKGSNPVNDENMSRPLGLFPQHASFGSLRPVCGAEQKPFAPGAVQPWPFRGVMPPNSPALRSVAGTSPTMKPPTAQLTIFYAGMVNVYDDVPADKAQAIMMLADSGNCMSNGFMKPAITAQQTPCASILSSMERASLSLKTSGRNKQGSIPTLPLPGAPNQNQPIRKLQSDLPIARKHSLQRFLEKRKDRLSNRGPYKGEVEELPVSVAVPPSLISRTFSGRCNETSLVEEASPIPVSPHIA